MTFTEKIENLRKVLDEANHAYYVKNKPVLSDSEYDSFMEQLIELENTDPKYQSLHSPSQRLGTDLVKNFPEVFHNSPMLSLANTYSEQELRDFDLRLKGLLPEKTQYTYVAEIKIDGLAMSIHYEKGHFIYGVTRGDGSKGNDISANLKTIRSIPLSVQGNNFPIQFEIRGEVYMTKGGFEALNKERIKNGEEPFANPRNAGAGSVKMQDSRLVAKRPLDALWYFIESSNPLPILHVDRLKLMQELGFRTNPVYEVCKDIDAVINFCKQWSEKRKSLDFETDGVVIKLNETNYYHSLGSTSKSPRWAIAFKFKADRIETQVQDITWQVGRTGAVTPVAELEPVLLAGTTVKRATLHNVEDLKLKDIRPGDTVEIEKGGDIIPKVVRYIPEKRSIHILEYQPPENCPVCNSPLHKFEEDAHLRCINPNCPAQIIRAIEHFVSKSALDIDGLGTKIVEQLFNSNLVYSIADLFSIKKESLLKLDKFKDKKADKLLAAIAEATNREWYRQLYALGIRYVGLNTAKLLARKYHSIEELKTTDHEELASIDGIGERIAESVVSFFNDRQNWDLILSLKNSGLKFEHDVNADREVSSILNGSTFVLTGALELLSRDEARDLIEKAGGRVTSSVSKNTDYVVAGESPGSKFEKAKTLGVRIIDQKELLSLVKGNVE